MMTIEIESITVIINGKKETIPWDKVSFSASSQECGMCGSHGEIEIDMGLGRYIDVHSW